MMEDKVEFVVFKDNEKLKTVRLPIHNLIKTIYK